jgi:hypothetical protein
MSADLPSKHLVFTQTIPYVVRKPSWDLVLSNLNLLRSVFITNYGHESNLEYVRLRTVGDDVAGSSRYRDESKRRRKKACYEHSIIT